MRVGDLSPEARAFREELMRVRRRLNKVVRTMPQLVLTPDVRESLQEQLDELKEAMWRLGREIRRKGDSAP